jgi:transposase InsO family protein
VLERISASIGGFGDAYNNALAETTIDDVEYATMEWVDWYTNRRLHSQLNYIPPDEYEAAHYADHLRSW